MESLRQAKRYEARVPLCVGDTEQHCFLAICLERINFHGDIAWLLDRLLIDFDDHIAGFQSLFGSAGIGIDIGYDDPRGDGDLDSISLSQDLAEA